MLNVPKLALWSGGGALLVIVVVFALRRSGTDAPKGVDADSALVGLPPLPRRVTVEVLNASGVDGLARVGMARLRRVGLDEVDS